jgi:hypothetical protein
MANYTITNLENSNEGGYVYADVLFNEQTEPIRLIIPETTAEAELVLADYAINEETITDPAIVTAEVSELIDQTQEV